MSNVNYEMVVSAKINTTPEFKIPEITPEEITIESLGQINNILSDAYQKLNTGTATAKVLKILGNMTKLLASV